MYASYKDGGVRRLNTMAVISLRDRVMALTAQVLDVVDGSDKPRLALATSDTMRLVCQRVLALPRPPAWPVAGVAPFDSTVRGSTPELAAYYDWRCAWPLASHDIHD